MKYWAQFWALGLIWGSSFLFIKIGVEELATFQLVSVRVGLAALLMLLFFLATNRRPPTNRRDLLSLTFVGFFNIALPFSLITRAEAEIDSSVATILNSTVPLFSLVIAHFALGDEKLTRQKVGGLAIGYLGVIILTSRGLDTDNPIPEQLMMLGAAISYAVAVVYIRLNLRHIEPITVAGSTLIIAAMMIIPLMLLLQPNFPSPAALETRTIFAVLMLGSVNTVIAYFLFYSLLGQWGARATTVTYTFPPIGIVLGAIFLGEPIDARLIIGAGLILFGVFAINYRPRRRAAVVPA